MRHDGPSLCGLTVGLCLAAFACSTDTVDEQPVLPAGNTAPEMPSSSAPQAGAGSSMQPPPSADGGKNPRDAGTTRTPLADAGAKPPAAMSDDSADSGAPDPAATSHCSGCSSEQRDATDTSIHLHHVHLKSVNRERSMSFYEQHFGAKRVQLNGVTPALLAAPILYLIDEVPAAPRSDLPVSLQHVGFGSTDVAAWYTKAHAQGVMPDTRGNTLFATNETPTIGQPGSGSVTNAVLAVDAPACFPLDADAFGYMYVLGPDQERIEVWTGADRRVNHVHFTTPDLAATVGWYQKFLGVGPNASRVLTSNIYIDDILFFFEPIGDKSNYRPTEDYVLSHIAFSVTDLARWVQRARDQNVEIVAQPAPVHGFNSFFVRGPDGLLVELVEAAPSALLCPEGPVTARPAPHAP